VAEASSIEIAATSAIDRFTTMHERVKASHSPLKADLFYARQQAQKTGTFAHA
jgi:hypothetical protein